MFQRTNGEWTEIITNMSPIISIVCIILVYEASEHFSYTHGAHPNRSAICTIANDN